MSAETKKKTVKVPKDPDVVYKSARIQNFMVAKIREGKTGQSLEKKLTQKEEDKMTAMCLWQKEQLWKEYDRYIKMMKRSKQL